MMEFFTDFAKGCFFAFVVIVVSIITAVPMILLAENGHPLLATLYLIFAAGFVIAVIDRI